MPEAPGKPAGDGFRDFPVSYPPPDGRPSGSTITAEAVVGTPSRASVPGEVTGLVEGGTTSQAAAGADPLTEVLVAQPGGPASTAHEAAPTSGQGTRRRGFQMPRWLRTGLAAVGIGTAAALGGVAVAQQDKEPPPPVIQPTGDPSPSSTVRTAQVPAPTEGAQSEPTPAGGDQPANAPAEAQPPAVEPTPQPSSAPPVEPTSFPSPEPSGTPAPSEPPASEGPEPTGGASSS